MTYSYCCGNESLKVPFLELGTDSEKSHDSSWVHVGTSAIPLVANYEKNSSIAD